MSTLNDCRFNALRLAGFTGATNDMLLQWAQAGGAISGALNDALLEYLLLNGATTPTLNDAWFEFLLAQGYTGTRNDMETEYWCALAAQVLVPDVVGLSQVDATAAITGAGLVLGTVTGTTDPVVSQDPVAGVMVDLGSAVDITITAVVFTDLQAMADCLVIQGWSASATATDITIEGITYNTAFIDACDYSSVAPAPLRIDMCECIQEQGKCLGGCP